MKGNMKKLLVVVLSFALLLGAFGVMAAGADSRLMIDDEVIRVLYEKTDNPEAWLAYLEGQSGDAMGKWLPLLIKKIASTEDGMAKELVDVSYTTVTEAFDWGPAITKVVLDFGTPIEDASLALDTFTVKSVRNYKDLDFATFTFAEKATDHIVERNVKAIYASDMEGNVTEGGAYVTIEMPVGPTMSEGSPFNYNFLSGFNEYVETSYMISVNPGSSVESVNGDSLVFLPTTAAEKAFDIKLIADDFTNDQPFSDGDIDLLYADFVPETASAEAGANPLIIWLHGAGEGGMDTTINLMGNKVVNLATQEVQQYFGDTGAYILAPQAPSMWMDYDGSGVYNSGVEGSMGTSYYTEALMALIEAYVADHPEIDGNRIYLGGCSNGGYMTVNMITEYPEYFAAAYPVCEAYSAEWLTEDEITAIKDLPIWLTAAVTDSVVPIAEGTGGIVDFVPSVDENGDYIFIDNFSNALYDRLVAAGSDSVYYSRFDSVVDTTGNYFQADGVTPYEYMGHWSWIYTLNNECVETIDGVETTIFEWLAAQSK